jgi:hypothetical protein
MDVVRTLTEVLAHVTRLQKADNWLRNTRLTYRIERDIWRGVAERLAQRVVYCTHGISARVESKEVQELLRATYDLSEQYVSKDDEDEESKAV